VEERDRDLSMGKGDLQEKIGYGGIEKTGRGFEV
jgi:hypothetical protein